MTADLAAGDYILTSKVSSVPVSSDVALNDIPSGKVAISLTVKTLASGLSDKLQPNDIVRIYHFLETAEEVPELRFVKVLSVTDSDGINVDNTKEPTEDEEPQQSATITVLASPEQARIITELENDGVAHVALISRNNDQLAEELLAEQDKTLQEIYFPETLTEDGENEGTDATGDPASAEDSGENTAPSTLTMCWTTLLMQMDGPLWSAATKKFPRCPAHCRSVSWTMGFPIRSWMNFLSTTRRC